MVRRQWSRRRLVALIRADGDTERRLHLEKDLPAGDGEHVGSRKLSAGEAGGLYIRLRTDRRLPMERGHCNDGCQRERACVS